MTKLLIDVGNTAIKWARFDAGALDGIEHAPHRGDVATAADALRAALRRGPQDLIVANVAGPQMAEALTRVALAECGREPRFVTSQDRQCGVRNAYVEPRRLGVDRWAAMIAGHARSRSVRGGAASCIIGAGTAVTFDAVREDGQHLGGLIIAGARLQAESLAARTSDIGLVALMGSPPGEGLAVLGHSTETAVAHGAWLAIAGALTSAFELVERSLSANPVVYLCGGDAKTLRSWLTYPVSLTQDLVLEGLALISDAED